MYLKDTESRHEEVKPIPLPFFSYFLFSLLIPKALSLNMADYRLQETKF